MVVLLYVWEDNRSLAESSEEHPTSGLPMDLTFVHHSWSLLETAHASAGPRVWNSLPEDVTSAPSLPVFRRKLKTHLVRHLYPDTVTAP